MQLTSLSECKHVHASFTFKAKFIEDNDTMDSAIAHTRYLRQPRSARPRSKKGGAAIKQGEQGLARSQVPLRHSAAFLLSKRLYRHPASRIRLSWNFRKSTGDPPAIKHFFWLKHAMEDLPLPCFDGPPWNPGELRLWRYVGRDSWKHCDHN